ncbi:MAG: MFS transporter [Bacteroidota bacterium]
MTNALKVPSHILSIIVFAQFAGTSLWFAVNAIIGDLQTVLGLAENAVGDITAAVQLGFIVGTLGFAFLSIADRYSPSKVFLVCAVLGALFNLGVYFLAKDLTSLLLLRFATGFFLAGIYPVGMKIAADWYAKGLGKALGYLVGALVLGTAFPHLLKTIGQSLPWEMILWLTSGMATLGGMLLFWLVPDGPNRKAGAKFEWNAIPKIFGFADFRAAAFGYFGHMWELYTFWAFVPLILLTYNEINQSSLPVSLLAFLIIAIGSLGCIIGGYISLRTGSKKVAFGMLLVSGICCLLSPFIFQLSTPLFLAILLIWGFTVVGDSPQFSTIVAKTAPNLYIGTALTIVNCIGFALTILSIQVVGYLQHIVGLENVFLVLLIGPIVGLITLKKGRTA